MQFANLNESQMEVRKMYLKIGEIGNQKIFNKDDFESAMLNHIAHRGLIEYPDVIQCDDAGNEVYRIEGFRIDAWVNGLEIDMNYSYWWPPCTDSESAFVRAIKEASWNIWNTYMTNAIRMKIRGNYYAFIPERLAEQLFYMNMENGGNLYAYTKYGGRGVVVAYANDLRHAVSKAKEKELYVELARKYFAIAESIYLKRSMSKTIRKPVRSSSRSL